MCKTNGVKRKWEKRDTKGFLERIVPLLFLLYARMHNALREKKKKVYFRGERFHFKEASFFFVPH